MRESVSRWPTLQQLQLLEWPQTIVLHCTKEVLPASDAGQYLMTQWNVAAQSARSPVMKTTLQAPDGDTATVAMMSTVRNELGIPPDNIEYPFIFLYPGPDSGGFFGGYGSWM